MSDLTNMWNVMASLAYSHPVVGFNLMLFTASILFILIVRLFCRDSKRIEELAYFPLLMSTLVLAIVLLIEYFK